MAELTEDQIAELDDLDREWFGFSSSFRSPYNYDGSLGVERSSQDQGEKK